MKFDFWLELPEVLSNLNGESMSLDDKKYSEILRKSHEVYIFLTYLGIQQNIQCLQYEFRS